MFRVNVVYHQFPHYRRSVMRELVLHGKNSYQFWGSIEPLAGIVPFSGDEEVPVRPLQFRVWKGLWLIKGYWPAVFDRSCDALIILANPNMPASWLMAVAARLTGKKVIFWGHGWLKTESFPKRTLRGFYYRLAQHMLVYGERARYLGTQLGYPKERITTIYNSLDFGRARILVEQIESAPEPKLKPRDLFGEPDRPFLICTARLTRLCRFDLLLKAAAHLKKHGRPVNVLLVGDGPERSSLEMLARELDVEVHFYGACYEEEALGQLIYGADITVSPGKIGLTVIHSLSYGTPAITHGDLDEQMPEVEAIEPGMTGAFFQRGDAIALANAIGNWLDTAKDRTAIRKACYASIARNWNPHNQRVLIEQAMDAVMGASGASA